MLKVSWKKYISDSSEQLILTFTVGIHHICRIIEPSFDTSRLITKIPATWEGLQAARQLQQFGIKSLATTLFSMEQAILAGETGCISISPFVHELKTQMVPGWAPIPIKGWFEFDTVWIFRQEPHLLCLFKSTAILPREKLTNQSKSLRDYRTRWTSHARWSRCTDHHAWWLERVVQGWAGWDWIDQNQFIWGAIE